MQNRYSKSSLEADKLIKAALIKKNLHSAYITKLHCVTCSIDCHYYHLEEKEMYIYKDIYVYNFIFPEETEKLCALNSVLIAT